TKTEISSAHMTSGCRNGYRVDDARDKAKAVPCPIPLRHKAKRCAAGATCPHGGTGSPRRRDSYYYAARPSFTEAMARVSFVQGVGRQGIPELFLRPFHYACRPPV